MVSETRRHVQLGKSTAEQLANPDYSDWTLEELLGVRTDRRGKRGGRPPNLVPMARIHEINRRLFQDDLIEMAASISEIRRYLLAIAKGEEAGDKDRIAVCTWIYERLLGKAPVQVDISVKEPSEYELAGVTRAVITRPVLDLDSEEVNPDLGPEDDDPFGFNEPDEPERKRERRRRRRDSRKEVSQAEETDERTHTANYPMRWHKDEQSPPKR